MKVLDLQCRQGHGFEGWFGSEDDFQTQLQRGLLECPLCGEREVVRRPSAPRLNLSGAREPQPPADPAAAAPADALAAAWMKAVREVMRNTEDVGQRFAEEARRIHHGEAEARGIRGQTTRDEAKALADEGIEVFSLPVPPALKEPLQ
ncbi:DUF1178 family protein [Caldimonas tepidiphila]|uniref:DUF1178 family protein n=1 Tax=Caldimonas tepidiphila TaxID=2315841 RepID=UPI000E5BB3D8|nr:DUF1178 family protein [Caldimonas tepidiphila]